MGEEKMITRRDFIRGTAGMAMATAWGAGMPEEARAEAKAKVVLIRNPQVLDRDGRVQPEIMQNMLDEALKTILSERETLPAWRKLFLNSDVVGIKSNSWGRLPTPPELEAAIRRRLLEIGVAVKNIRFDARGVLNNPL